MHVGVLPGNATSHFGAVGYFAMEEAGLTPRKSTVDVTFVDGRTRKERTEERMVDAMERKMDAYRWGMTGDHMADVENWYEHCHGAGKGSGGDSGSGEEDINWVLEQQRPYYRLCPPRVTERLAQLYGLLPYSLITLEQRARERSKALVRRGAARDVRHQPRRKEEGVVRAV